MGDDCAALTDAIHTMCRPADVLQDIGYAATVSVRRLTTILSQLPPLTELDGTRLRPAPSHAPPLICV